MTDTQKRFATAGVVIPILLVFFWLGGWWFFGLLEFVVLIGMTEFYRMAGAKGIKTQKIIGTIFGLALPALFFFEVDPFIILLALVLLILIVLGRQLFQDQIPGALNSVALTILGVLYVSFLLSHLLLLRNFVGRQGRVDLGLFFIVLVIAITFLSDAGGFLIGRTWGKHKMSPKVSPKKSWEGAGGSVVFGIGGAIGTKLVFDKWILATNLPLHHAAILGLILVIAAMFGDVVESLFKRDAGIKDSGTIVPGHGGILDRLDSIVFTVPICYYYLRLIVHVAGGE
jgi:phosphatidate cytidylyltransferase